MMLQKRSLPALMILFLAGCESSPSGPTGDDGNSGPTSNPPVVTVPSDLEGFVGQPMGFVYEASDPDGDEFTVKLIPHRTLSEFRTGYSPEASINEEIQAFTFTPSEQDVPRRGFTLEATDIHGTKGSIEFEVKVFEPIP